MSDGQSADGAGAAQSAAAPSPFPPIADYAFLSNCHTGALVAPGRRDRLAVRPRVRLAERLRQPARPAGRVLPARAVRDQPPLGPGVRAGDERARDDVEDAGGLDRRPRRADDGPDEPTRTPSRRTRGRRPTTTATTCSSGRSSASTAGSRSSSSASRRSTTARRRRSGRSSTASRHAADANGGGHDAPARLRPRARHRGKPRPRAPCAGRRASVPTARSRWAEGLAAPQTVEEAEARIAATVRFWRAWLGRARIPDHRCATRSSAPRSRSRASRTCPLGPRSPR